MPNLPDFEGDREAITQSDPELGKMGRKNSPLELARKCWELATHGDYSNGVEHLGTDEGMFRATELLHEYEKELKALEATHG